LKISATRATSAALEVLAYVLLVLVPLLLPELSHFVLQLDDGPLDLKVLTDQRHPAVEGTHTDVYNSGGGDRAKHIPVHGDCKLLNNNIL